MPYKKRRPIHLGYLQKRILCYLAIRDEWVHYGDIGNAIDPDRSSRNLHWCHPNCCDLIEHGLIESTGHYYKLTAHGLAWVTENFRKLWPVRKRTKR